MVQNKTPPLEPFTPEEDAQWNANFQNAERDYLEHLRKENERLAKEVARLKKELRNSSTTCDACKLCSLHCDLLDVSTKRDGYCDGFVRKEKNEGT